jgi:hypothetical protein
MVKETDYGARFELLVAVESDDVPNGTQLVAHLLADDRQPSDRVTPGVIAGLVRSARQNGWDPAVPGSAPTCDDHLLELVRAADSSA